MKFYAQAATKYQIHSPFVFELAQAVVEDDRFRYSFDDIAFLREQLLQNRTPIELTDFGAGSGGAQGETGGVRVHHRTSTVARVAQMSGSSEEQGRRLFRLVDHLKPKKILEFGTSLGLSTLYMGTAARDAEIISLEGCPACVAVARQNAKALGLQKVEIMVGAFEQTLIAALQKLGKADLIFFDGNHRREPTLRYFEACLPFAHTGSVFVFDDIFWSRGMLEAWRGIQNHPQVTLTVDFFDIGLAFFRPEMKEKQHFRVVPSGQKPWTKFI